MLETDRELQILVGNCIPLLNIRAFEGLPRRKKDEKKRQEGALWCVKGSPNAGIEHSSISNGEKHGTQMRMEARKLSKLGPNLCGSSIYCTRWGRTARKLAAQSAMEGVKRWMINAAKCETVRKIKMGCSICRKINGLFQNIQHLGWIQNGPTLADVIL